MENMEILIKDGIKYKQYDFHGEENEFEQIVFTQYKHLFGDNAILFTKQKIKTETDIGTIPDGFVIDFEKEKWFIIEIEISNHDVYKHIAPQLLKFRSALKNHQTKKDLIKSFENEIKKDPFKTALLLANGKNEIFKTVSEIIDKEPELIIIIEQQHNELSNVFKEFPFKTLINVFKIYCRSSLIGENIFQIEPLFQCKQQIKIQATATEIKDEDIEHSEDTVTVNAPYLNSKNAAQTKLKVIFSNGKVISENKAIDTFIKTVQEFGIAKVKQLLIGGGAPIISDKAVNDNVKTPYKLIPNTQFYIINNNNTIAKKDFIEKIAKMLNEKIKVEIAEK